MFAEVGDECGIKALGGDGQHALDDRGVFGVTQRGVAEQRVDRCQPGVAGADAVASPGLQVLQEGADQRGVEIGDLEAGGRLAGLLRGEGEQQLEGVAVGGDGVRAGLALADQPVGHVGLQGGGEAGHGCRSRCASRRCPARAISSGAADRYQKVCLGSACPR